MRHQARPRRDIELAQFLAPSGDLPSPAHLPPNADLVFDVELKTINGTRATVRCPGAYDAANDLPPIDDEELGLLWPCECHDQCGPDRFNNRDPPWKKKVKQQTGGEAEETGIFRRLVFAGRRDLESGDEQHVQKMVEGATHHNYVELKTTEWIDDRLQAKKKIQQKLNNYDRRKIKYWGQSYLIGCPTIIVGKKDSPPCR
ncbi:putative dhp1-interacting protein [Diplodia seriata]|uniref:Putative dhp1-interacting protein n=1 Tax=Diplodia seriata TaxID=420778 RepID=A0A0G2EGN4_9PEZI|nr:putative dhp1-interacting protein [Diplodia seriata]